MIKMKDTFRSSNNSLVLEVPTFRLIIVRMSEYMADVCPQASFTPTASEQSEASFGASLNVYQSHVFPITWLRALQNKWTSIPLFKGQHCLEKIKIYLCHADRLWMKPVVTAVWIMFIAYLGLLACFRLNILVLLKPNTLFKVIDRNLFQFWLNDHSRLNLTVILIFICVSLHNLSRDADQNCCQMWQHCWQCKPKQDVPRQRTK